MDGDLFLRWLSLRGEGNLRNLAKTVLDQATGTTPPSLTSARYYLRGLEDLGHIDLSWSDNTWRIRPPTITNLPGTSAVALVSGERFTGLHSILDSEFLLHEIASPQREGTVFADPAILLIEFDDEDDLSSAAKRLGGVYVPCSAFSIAASLTRVTSGSKASPNYEGAPLEMYDISAYRFIGVDFPRKNGLFRQMANGRYNYWIYKDGTSAWTNYDEGICLLWGEAGKAGLQLAIAKDSADAVGTLHVDSRLPLPPQQRRALTLCSGLRPRVGKEGLEYRNVPASVATYVASSVHQRLAVV